MSVLTLTVVLALLPFSLWVGLLLLQALGAALPVPAVSLASRRAPLAILIPAHNEAAGIARTLNALLPQLQKGDRLLVVADNCSDDTAAVAAGCGAEVTVRNDAALRGKGYALAHGVACLAQTTTPAVLIIVDADCVVEAGSVDCLVRACSASGRPQQALYLMSAPEGSSSLAGLREFAWRVRNLVRPLGGLRFGMPCQLMGTGMAFPWPLISTAQLANAHLVEDMQLGVDLARAGAAPMFCPQALVWSEFPPGEAGAQQQRRRWEHGHLGMIVGAVPGLLLEGVFQRKGALLALALDMSVPPLALLLLLLCALSATFVFLPAVWPLLWAAALLAALFGTLMMAWWCHGRSVVSLRVLLQVPRYALAKLPLYLGFLHRRQVEWERSKRN